MSETTVVGQIKIVFNNAGLPNIEIIGDIPPRQYNALPFLLGRELRAHAALVRKGRKKVDMSDKGTKVEDAKTTEAKAKLNETKPTPGADELKITPPPAATKANPITKPEANKPIEKKEITNATNKGAATVRKDDEGPGSKEDANG